MRIFPLFLLLPTLALADQSLYDLPLEDLMNLEVSTASKQAESYGHSPGVIAVLERHEIEGFGAVHLGELLERMTSVYFTGTLPFPQGMLAIRGDVTAEQNNHVLVLLNGRPLRDSIYSGLNQDLYTAFPITSLRRIEVVRGPGSVLYGTNAFVGVINLITRSSEALLSETSITYGSFDTKAAQTYFSTSVGEALVSAAISYASNRGWELTASDWNNTATSSTSQSQLQYTRTVGGVLTGKWKGFSLNSYADISEVPFISLDSSLPLWALSGNERLSRITTDLGYEARIEESWRTTANITYNHLARTNRVTGATNEGTSHDVLVELASYHTFSPRWTGLLGATYTKQTGSATHLESSTPTIAFYREDVYSLYAQTAYHVADPLKIHVGGQLIKFASITTNLVPRLGATYAFNDELGLKALYSKAYRAASQSERFLVLIHPNRTVSLGNPSLEPETIGTFDLQGYYQDRRVQGAITLFLSRQNNLIFPVSTSGKPVYSNLGHATSKGIEAEGKALLSESVTLVGNASYQTSVTDQGSVDDGHTPPLMLKWGILYDWKIGVRAGLYHEYFQSPQQVDNGGGNTHEVNPRLSYQNDLSLKLIASLNDLIDWRDLPKTEISLYGSNLFDSRFQYPEYVYGIINAFPGRSGRAVFATLTVSL